MDFVALFFGQVLDAVAGIEAARVGEYYLFHLV
jgi:hypothetical protein